MKIKEEDVSNLKTFQRFYSFCFMEIAISKDWDLEEDLVSFLDKHFEDKGVIASSMHSGGSDYLLWENVKSLLKMEFEK